MSAGIATLDAHTSILDRGRDGKLTGFISSYFSDWILALLTRLQLGSYQRAVLTKTAQAAAVVGQRVWTVDASGLFTIGFVARVTQAASTSSSFQVTLRWSRNGTALSKTFTLVNGNSVTSFDTGFVLGRCDGLTDVLIDISYASVGATPMQFEYDVVVVQGN